MSYGRRYYGEKLNNVRYGELNAPKVGGNQKTKTGQLWLILAACVMVLIVLSACNHDEMMKTCQKTHSYETCAATLN